MINFHFLILITLLISCTTKTTVHELPRPNSGTYSYAQANKHRNEIYSLKKSSLQPNWKNPYTGYTVHVSKNDLIFVNYALASNKEMTIVEFSRFALNTLPQWGNPIGVLVTSEIDPKKSKVFSELIDILFAPNVQIFYLK